MLVSAFGIVTCPIGCFRQFPSANTVAAAKVVKDLENGAEAVKCDG